MSAVAFDKVISPPPAVLSDPQASFKDSVNQTAQSFFKEIETKRSSLNQNFFFFTPTILSIFGMLYRQEQDAQVQQNLKAFLHAEGVHDYHAQFSQWLKEISRTPGVANQNKPHFLLALLYIGIERVISLAKLFFPRYFSYDTTLVTKGLVAHHESVTIPEPSKEVLSHYADQTISFSSSEEAENFCNEWVKGATKGHIPQLIEDQNPDTLLILASAAFLQSNWVHPFNYKTKERYFVNLDGWRVKIDAMELYTDNLRMMNDRQHNIKMLELPMHGNLVMYVVILLDYQRGENIKDYFSSPDLLEHLKETEHFYRQRGLEVAMPTIDLKDRLNFFELLGDSQYIRSIKGFDWQNTLVTLKPGDPRQAQITDIISQTNLQLDRTGVRIAAATYSSSGCQSCPPTFIVNRPFGLVLFDKRSETILGMGQINQLQGKSQ